MPGEGSSAGATSSSSIAIVRATVRTRLAFGHVLIYDVVVPMGRKAEANIVGLTVRTFHDQ